LLTDRDKDEEWTVLPVLDSRRIARARDPLFNASLVAQPSHKARIESGVEQVASDGGAHQREARSIHPLAYAREDVDLVGASQCCAHDPSVDFVLCVYFSHTCFTSSADSLSSALRPRKSR